MVLRNEETVKVQRKWGNEQVKVTYFYCEEVARNWQSGDAVCLKESPLSDHQPKQPRHETGTFLYLFISSIVTCLNHCLLPESNQKIALLFCTVHFFFKKQEMKMTRAFQATVIDGTVGCSL